MLVILVPYRDREAQKDIFIPHMKAFLDNKGIHYKIIICEQSDDDRPFNRGAIRNIAFIEAVADGVAVAKAHQSADAAVARDYSSGITIND